MTRVGTIGVMLAILLGSSASWYELHKSSVNGNQAIYTQGFLKDILIPQDKYLQADLLINNYRMKVDIAGTPQQQQTGLAIKSALKENDGMLFPFPNESYQGFWMKDMKFPIDIMWIDKNNTIVYIQPNLPPCVNDQNCPIYRPNVKVIYVLETVAGFAQKHHIVVGQSKISARLIN